VARNVINEHGGYYEEDVHYTIVTVGNDDRAVEINQGSAWEHIWEFEAYDSVTGDPGYINYIRIQPTGDVGLIRLRIVGDVGHMYGARDVKRINLLTGADAPTMVYSVYISNDFGADGPMLADDVGSVAVYGDLLGSIPPSYDITGNVVIGGQLQAYVVGNALADVTVSGTGMHTGNITARTGDIGAVSVAGRLSGNLTCAGDANGSITIAGPLSGSIEIGASANSSIDIGGPVTGNVTVGGDVSDSMIIRGDLLGGLSIGGRLTGSVVIDGDVPEVGDNHIRIYKMEGGTFSCRDMDLAEEVWGEDFVIGMDVVRVLPASMHERI
jgi:hypothetical protein